MNSTGSFTEKIPLLGQTDGISEHGSVDGIDENLLDEEIIVDGWKVKVGDLLLRIAHVAFGILRLISFPFENLVAGRNKKGVGEYCFTQQYNDSCHISPLMNMKILEKIREVGYDLSKVDYHTRREWLGENQEMLVSWHHLMADLCKDGAQEKYPHIFKYMTDGINSAPIFPHFYNEEGEIPFKGLEGLIEFGEMPFFMIDVEDLQKVSFRVMCMDIDFGDMVSPENLGLRTGIVNDKGVYKIYNSETKAFDPIDDLDWISIEEVGEDDEKKSVVRIDRSAMPDGDLNRYPLPPEGYEIVMRDVKGLGFSQFGVVNELGGGFKLKNHKGEVHTYIPFQMSLIKLMFLAAGLDENNQPITPSHPQFKAYQELQGLMRKDRNNMWHPENLDHDKFMQYHLAEMFKEDPELFRKAKGVVDVLTNNWLNHKKVKAGDFRNVEGNPIQGDGVKDYVLGDEQAVAYYLMQNIRMAWYSGVNPKVLINSLELGLPEGLAPMTHQYLLSKLKAPHNIKLSDGSTTTESFLTVWDQILVKLNERAEDCDRQDFMSFDDHGWVVSLDEELIARQNDGKVYDRGLLQRLGIAGVESWWGSELNLWYKRNREKVSDQSKPAEVVDTTTKV